MLAYVDLDAPVAVQHHSAIDADADHGVLHVAASPSLQQLIDDLIDEVCEVCQSIGPTLASEQYDKRTSVLSITVKLWCRYTVIMHYNVRPYVIIGDTTIS